VYYICYTNTDTNSKQTTMQTQTTNTQSQIEFLKGAYAGMNEAGVLRSFMSIGRETLGVDWFSARGIFDSFNVDYRVFFKGFFAEENAYYAETHFDAEKIASFAAKVREDISSREEDEKATILKHAHKAVNGNEILAALRGVTVTAPVKPEVVEEVKEVKPITTGATIAATPVKTEYKNEKAQASFNLSLPLSEMVNGAVTDYIENSGLIANVEARIKEEAAKLNPTVITIANRPTVKLSGRLHTKFEKTLRLAVRHSQAYITGAAGTGKTTLAKQVAEAMSLPFASVSCSAGMSEAHILGRMTAHGEYLSSKFVELYENGGVFLFDEIDAADANTLLVINSALANGYISVPNRVSNPTANRHENFVCLCAANTVGFGSNEYAGRNILDAAFLDRFAVSKVVVDYDTVLEAEISKEFPEVAKTFWTIRKNIAINKMSKRLASTRAIIHGVQARLDGETMSEILETYFIGWTTEEIRKAKDGL
jgi:cobaltochelatase CobS